MSKVKYRNLKEMKDSIMVEINKPIPKNRIMSNEYDLWLNEQNKECKDCLCSRCTDNGNPETSPNDKELLSIMNGCMHCLLEKDCKTIKCRLFKEGE